MIVLHKAVYDSLTLDITAVTLVIAVFPSVFVNVCRHVIDFPDLLY